jgi:ribose/xylose/arabinose/galactoside ABC-type transport system permease subunit
VLNGFSFLPALLITLILGIFLGSNQRYAGDETAHHPVIATLVTLNLFKGIALLIVPNGLSAIKGSAEVPMPGMDQRFRPQGCAAGPTVWRSS